MKKFEKAAILLSLSKAAPLLKNKYPYGSSRI